MRRLVERFFRVAGDASACVFALGLALVLVARGWSTWRGGPDVEASYAGVYGPARVLVEWHGWHADVWAPCHRGCEHLHAGVPAWSVFAIIRAAP